MFHDTDYFETFLQGLEESHKRFGLEVQAYCLMSNHYHLLIKTPRANLSRIMRHVDGLYTQRHNRLRQTDGSLFRGRYKAIVVEASDYLLQVSRYIHRNPIETKKPLVTKLEEYPWSSYPNYINQASLPNWLNRETVYGELASPRRYQAYRQYVDQGNNREISQFYGLSHTPSLLGGQDFKQEMKKKMKKADIEIDSKALQQPIKLSLIVNTVAAYYQLNNHEIIQTKRGKGTRNLPRWMAMKLCQELGSAKLTEIAERFNLGHYSTVSQTIGRLNRLLGEDAEIRRVYELLSQDLTP